MDWKAELDYIDPAVNSLYTRDLYFESLALSEVLKILSKDGNLDHVTKITIRATN